MRHRAFPRSLLPTRLLPDAEGNRRLPSAGPAKLETPVARKGGTKAALKLIEGQENTPGLPGDA